MTTTAPTTTFDLVSIFPDYTKEDSREGYSGYIVGKEVKQNISRTGSGIDLI